jgi:diphthamide biosynthesis methyltransferase
MPMIFTVFDLTKYVISITQSTCWGATILSRFQMGDNCLVTFVEHSRTNTRPTYLQTPIEECTQQLLTSFVALDLDTQHM